MSSARTLTDDERLDWLRLSRSENVGPITFFQLIRRFGSAGAALDALPRLARRGGRNKPIRVCGADEAQRECEATTAAQARLVAAGEADYPPALALIPDAPPIVSVRGRTRLAADPASVVAVVGARNASGNGRRFARELAAELGRRGVAVASGLARGIDGAAHTGALDTGTIAVVAGGIDVPYPAENAALYSDIADRGLLLSEQPLGVSPQARHFPRRNRMISGVALGVVVVEAAPRSGSLITARTALEQGREVFAVPGSPLDPRCRDTNHLLRQGATLTESADDVLQVLESMRARPLAEPDPRPFSAPAAAEADDPEFTGASARIAELIGPAPIPIDELIRQTELTPAAVLTILLELELAGRVQRHPGNQVSGR